MSKPLQLGVVNYKKGSFILVEGKSDSSVFFIIRQGQVQIQRESEILDENQGNVLKPGDFFGVVECMSGHPRIESAVALTDVSLIVVRRDQFGVLLQRNAPIALKIIRSFSNKLRFFDAQITKLSFKSALEENPSYLFNIGEYYFKQKQFKQAAYAYTRYLQYCKDGVNVPQAKARLKTIGPLAQAAIQSAQAAQDSFTRRYSDSQMIFCEHEYGNELYIIQQGKVKITKIVDNNEVLLAVLKPGDIFGEMALLNNKPRSASAIAFGDVTLLAVNRENFDKMVASQPQLATKIIQLLSERIWIAYRQLENILISDPLGRLYDTLLTQVQKARVPIEKNKQYMFDFGPDELIRMVGIPIDKGRIIVKQLFENPKIKLVDGKIQVLDLEELAKQVSFFKKMSARERQKLKAKEAG